MRRPTAERTRTHPQLDPYTVQQFLLEHFRSSNLLREPDGPKQHVRIKGQEEDEEEKEAECNTYDSNAEFWRDATTGILTALCNVELRGFKLSDWYPRAPGLFHSGSAGSDRLDAESRIVEIDGASFFSPEGKGNMIAGGFGCVRFKDVPIQNEHCWLCTATSDGYCHSGIPLAIPNKLWRKIRMNSGALFFVKGRMDFLPAFFAGEYFGHLVRIPQLYVMVEAIYQVDSTTEPVFVTPMVFFTTSPGPATRTFNVTYVTCPANDLKAIDKGADWLSWYVDYYRGEIHTNFDQQRPTFENVPFSLQKIMTGRADPRQLRSLATSSWMAPNDFFDGIETAYGNVNILVQGDIVKEKIGRDKIAGDKVGGNKVGGDMVGGNKVGGDIVGHNKIGGDMEAAAGGTKNIVAPGSEDHKRTSAITWVFGFILLAFLISFVFWSPANLQPAQQKTVRLLCAVFTGLLSAGFTGSLKLGGVVPKTNLTIAAVGGAAAFALIYLLW